MKDQVTNVLRLSNLVRENIQTKQLFTPFNQILITFSGGQDSLFSLLILYLLQDQLGLNYGVVQRQIATKTTQYVPASRSHFVKVRRAPITSSTENRRSGVQNLRFKEQRRSGRVIKKLSKSMPSSYRINEFDRVDFVSKSPRSCRCSCRLFVLQFLPNCGQESEQQRSSATSFLSYKIFDFVRASSFKAGTTTGHVIDNRPSFRLCTPKKINKMGVSSYAPLTDKDQILPYWLPEWFDNSSRHIGKFGLLWCNHFWQKESFHTMLHVAKLNLCFSSQICFFLPIDNVLCEQNAREWRHKSIQRTCAFFHYACCTQGHTKSDRVETIFFNILRGTGVAGLQMLQWKKSFYSFSCQRFYPRLSTSKLKFIHPITPLLKLTRQLYKRENSSKFCFVNVVTEPAFKLPTRYS